MANLRLNHASNGSMVSKNTHTAIRNFGHDAKSKIRLPTKMADLQVAEFNLNVTQAVTVNERQVIKNGSDYSNNVHFSSSCMDGVVGFLADVSLIIRKTNQFVGGFEAIREHKGSIL